MTKPALITTLALSIAFALLSLTVSLAPPSLASLPNPEAPTGEMRKGGMLSAAALGDAETVSDTDGEWIFDCYDQFGGDGADLDQLDACLPS